MYKKILLSFFAAFFMLILNAQTAIELYDEGVLLMDKEKYKEAIVAFKNAITKDPVYTDALFEAGWCLNETKQYKEAVTYLQKAAELSPKTSKIFYELGYASYNSNQPEKAIIAYKKVLELDPEYYSAAKSLANIYYDTADCAKALYYYDQYFKAAKVNNIYYYRAAWCANDLEKHQDALSYLENYTPEKDNDRLSKCIEVGYANYKLKKDTAALAAYWQGLGINPLNGKILRSTGNVYYEHLKKYDSAQYYYEKAIKADEKSSQYCYYKLGWIYNDTEKYDNAINVLKKAIAYDAKDAANMEEIGYAYYKKDKFDDAIIQFKKGIALDPKSKQCHYYLGLCYVSLKQKRNAKEVYKTLKTIDEGQAKKLEDKIKEM